MRLWNIGTLSCANVSTPNYTVERQGEVLYIKDPFTDSGWVMTFYTDIS